MGHRLLVVDSDRRFLQDHRASLESAFDVDFRDGTEGSLSHLENGAFAAVLLCVEASENKGYSLCSAIRRSPVLGDLKVALISAKATEEEYARHQSLKGKADLYLHKPIRPNALVSALTPMVPLRSVDPDNPLGDLGGTDLGDEWLESLKSELEIDPIPHAAPPPARQSPAPPAQPQIQPVPVATVLGFTRPLLPLAPPTAQSLPPIPKDAGRVELLEARVKDLETKLVTTCDELDRRNQDLAERAGNEAAAQTLFEEKTLLAMELETSLARANAALELAQAAQEQSAQELEELRAQEEEARGLLQEKTQLTMDMMESNQLLQAQLAEAREDAERLSQSQVELQTRAAGLDSRTAELDSRSAELESRIAGQESRIAELESRIAEREARIAEQASDIAEQEARIAEREARIAEQASSIAEQESRIADQEARLAGQESERSERQAAMERVEASENELRRQLAGLEENHERQQMELLAAIDDREARLGRLETAAAGLREQILLLEQEKETARGQLQARSDRLQAVTGQLADLEALARRALEFAKTEMD